jgi:hypothetical protein
VTLTVATKLFSDLVVRTSSSSPPPAFVRLHHHHCRSLTMHRLSAIISLLLLALSQTSVLASPCVTFDINFNLLGFGFNGKDWNAGTQDVWASAPPATDITAAGRPPFDGQGTTCYLAQFFNAIYVLNGDARNSSLIYIYDATAKSWSTQITTPGTFDYSSFDTILDHDTNVFYALSKGSLYSLDMGTMKFANNSVPLPWNQVQNLNFPADYNPVMALAQNHIHFLNVGTDGPGVARIFVIHFSYLQPELQSYPGVNNATFPAAHGQVTSFFKDSGVQEEFAFIPDDFSGTYVVNVENNSTRTLPPPTVKDPKSSFVAGITSLVQLDSTGAVTFVSYTPSNDSSVSWNNIKALAAVSPPTPSISSSSSKPQATGTNSTHQSADGALSSHAVTSGIVGLAILFAVLGFL